MKAARRGMVGLAVFVLAVSGVLVCIVPAQALDGSKLIGHRCRNYPAATNNEDTIAALLAVSRVSRVWCEVDAWTIADGTVIIWHDATWRRVADHDTLPPGLGPGSRVADATWEQVRQIRTKGGQPVARLGKMIRASGRHRVPLLVEIKNWVADPSTWVTHAKSRGARVRYYKGLTHDCGTDALDSMRDAGAPIGLKVAASDRCSLTPAEMQAKGVSLVSLPASRVTPEHSEELRTVGIRVHSRGATATTAKTLLANGAARLIVRHPRAAARW